MARHEQVTFTRGHEILEHAIEYLTWIRNAMEELRQREHPERVKMLLNSVEVEERNLLGALERLLEDTSDKVLGTYAQYTVEIPTEVRPPDEPLTTLGLIRWLQGLNDHLQKLFTELSEKGDSQEVAEVFAGVARQVEAHARRLSKEYQRTEDL